MRTHGAAVALRPVFFVWSRAPLLLRWTMEKASPMVMKHVEGALDVVVKDDDAVKALLLGWTIGRVMPRRQRMSKALLLGGG